MKAAGSRSVYLGKDVLGSVRSMTADTGMLEDRYEYDAFGTPYQGDLSGWMNLGCTGKPYDTATGLYNYGFRDYRPQAARFTTEDPVRDGSNWFAYVNNDPVNWVDPWGLEPLINIFRLDAGGGSTNKNSQTRPGYSQAGQLSTVQSLTRNAEMYQKGGGGRYPSATGADTTFCNQATFDVAEATGFNTAALYNGVNRDNVKAAAATQNLANAAVNGTVTQVNGGQAQALANMGYTVVAAGNSHLATVSPVIGGFSYPDDHNPLVSQVGDKNKITDAYRAFTDPAINI